MKTKQQIAEHMFWVLREKMSHQGAEKFHSDARLREDLGLDSASVLQLVVLLEVEFGISLPEDSIINEDFDTVRNVTKLLFDAQERAFPARVLDYEEDIKLHCFVSCLSEVLKRCQIDQRVLYFGVWDSEIVVSDDAVISYHSESIRHDFFAEWFERLFGIEVREWYQPHLGKDENVQRLVRLVEGRSAGEHIMVMLDMHRLPERVNEFNKDPFPHYLMLGTTPDPDLWMMYDPDYRWEGVIAKERILFAMRHPNVRGGFVFHEGEARAPDPSQIVSYYEACMRLYEYPMTTAIRSVVEAHLAAQSPVGVPLRLSDLPRAVEEVPVLSIRKYAYEHGLAFFFRELNLTEEEFDSWCEVIAELVKTYKAIQFHAVKLAATGDRRIADRVFTLLDEQERREGSIKRRMHEVYSEWRDVTFESKPAQAAWGTTG